MLYFSLLQESIFKNSDIGFLLEESITVFINKHKQVHALQNQVIRNAEHFHQQDERLFCLLMFVYTELSCEVWTCSSPSTKDLIFRFMG